MSEPTVRRSGRVVLLDARDRLLLHHVRVPGRDVEVWITPGGGLDDGESYADAARRELWEETGLRVDDVGGCVWTRRHIFPMRGTTFDSIEHFFVVRVDRWDAQPVAFEAEEARFFLSQAWWSVDEIAASPDLFAPRLLAKHVQELLRNGPPSTPVDVGI